MRSTLRSVGCSDDHDELRRRRSREPRSRARSAPEHESRGAASRAVRSCWYVARASTSGTTAAGNTSKAMAGLWCTTLGYGDEELARVAYEQIKKLSFSHLFTGKSHEPGVLLADKLVGMAPFAASRAFFGNSGSDANDTQIKLVLVLQQRDRPPGQEEDHRAPQGLSRHDARVRRAHGLAGVPQVVRRAVARNPAHRCALLLPRRRGRRAGGRLRVAARFESRESDRARGPRHRRGVHRRAADGRGRRAAAAAHVLRESAGSAHEVRHLADRRRGHHGVRPHRRDLGRAGVRDAAEHVDGREGACRPRICRSAPCSCRSSCTRRWSRRAGRSVSSATGSRTRAIP